MPGSFFDSNVLLYLAATDATKAARTEQLLRGPGKISVQILNECASVLRRKWKKPWREVVDFLAELKSELDVYPLTIEIHDAGLRLAERYGFAIYDSFIVAAALEAGCDTLWSEDMQDGLRVEDRLRIANPFAA